MTWRETKKDDKNALGPGPPGPCGRGLQGLGAGPLNPGPKSQQTEPFVLKKSPGGRQAKGWETAETAAAEVGAWREAGTGYPPYPRVSRL